MLGWSRVGDAGRARTSRPECVLVVVVVAIFLAGCGVNGNSATGSTHAETRLPSANAVTTTTEPPLPVAPISWGACGSDLQCGSVTVPLDYSHPDGATIQIAVERHPAEVSAQRIGSLVINPGGPGGSGINDLGNELRVLTTGLLDDFDIV